MYPKMKRKVAKAGALRLSPNEEAQLLKEERERRRRLRLQQVREQERNIALQIRQDVKQRRDEQLHQLAEELKTQWQKAQEEKINALEKLYLSGLRAVGEGHRQAKENEPDLEALARQAEERKQRAETRHKEALKEQKIQREKLLREQIWRAKARRHAFQVEKERAAKIASLPPPPPHPSENVDLKSAATVKVCTAETFSLTHHHLFDPYVDREMDTEQPDARLLAEEKAKQVEGLQSNKERERRERLEKAHLRGKHALKVVRLAQEREKLMKELEQMQNIDLAHRRQMVAQMPPQLFEPTYRRVELKEEWQRDLECAFEDMCTGNRRMKGDLILHLDPQPLPTLSVQSQDDDLELSQEPDSVCEAPPKQEDEVEDMGPGVSHEVEKASEPPSRVALKKLLSKIRNQKHQWTSRDEPESQSDIGTIESGTIPSGERRLCESDPEQEPKDAPVCEGKELSDRLDQTVVAGNVILNHPQEQVIKTGKGGERQKQMEWLEQQQQQQLALLQQIEEQKIRLEVDVLKAEMQQREVERELAKKDQESPTVETNGIISGQQPEAVQKSDGIIRSQTDSNDKESDHIQIIRDYQQRLLEQNRMHRESVEGARKRLQEYQTKLKQRCASVSAALLGPGDRLAKLNSVPELRSQLQGFDMLQKVNFAAAAPPSRQDPGQEPARYSAGSLGQETKEPTHLDAGQIQPDYTSVDQRTSQLTLPSSQQKEKLDATEVPTTQSTECHRIPGLSVPRWQDTSVTAQSVAFAQGSQFTSSSGKSGSLEKLWSDKFPPRAPLAETAALPASSVTQPIPTEDKISPTLDQAGFPSQPISPKPSSKASGTEETQEFSVTRNGVASSPTYSDLLDLRDRMLASSESIQAQQEHLRELQEQLDGQRDALLSRQKVQEDILLQRHSQLKQQMERQQEALREFLKRAKQSSISKEMTEHAQETHSFSLLASLCKEAEDDPQEETCFSNMNRHDEKNLLFQNVGSAEQIEPFPGPWGKEQKWRLSKPPLAKVKLGLDLQQHELSAIPELDTPRSGNLSTTGCRECLTEDTSLTSHVDVEQSSLFDSLCIETDMLRITADSKRQSSSESLDQLREAWQERSVTEAVGLSDSAKPRELPLTDPRLSSSAADAPRRRATHSDPSLSPNNMAMLPTSWSPGPLSPQTCAQQVACGYFSSATLSTASFITSYNPNRSLVSTEASSANEPSRHFSSPGEKKKSKCAWDPLVSLPNEEEAPPSSPRSSLSFGEMLHSIDSDIQEIIDKYPREFSWSSLSNVSSHEDPVVGADVLDLERNFPNFHHELFQPLEPVPDFNIFSSRSQCRISRNSKNSEFSKSSHDLTVSSLEERNDRLWFPGSEELSNILFMEHAQEEKEKTQGAGEFLEPPPVEFPPSDLGQDADNARTFSIVPKESPEIGTSVQNGSLTLESGPNKEQESTENVSLSSSIENFRSLSPGEDELSFYPLVPDDSVVKDAIRMTESLKENVSSREQTLCFVELPSTSTERKQEDVIRTADVDLDLSRCTLRNAGEQSPQRTDIMLSLPRQVDSTISTSLVENSELQSGCELNTFPQPDQNSLQLKSSDSHLSEALPVWGKLSGRGIMEEPELTLISSNDISIAESDLTICSQTDSKKEKSENLSCGHHSENRGFLPLSSEVDHSVSTSPDSDPPIALNSEEDLGQIPKPEAMLSGFPSASLQESFLKRKKDFIERSSKRLENLKNRQRSSRKPQAKAPQQKKTPLCHPKENMPPKGAAAAYLKKVEEVKVCSAVDRKTVELQMLQRTSRLYSNLAEVKTRREEKERQENYAKNREKAKEFQKKTLEKLRARKANVKN